jgi:hypothetical protein
MPFLGGTWSTIDHYRSVHPVATLGSLRDVQRLERSAKLIHHLVRALGQSPKLLVGLESGKVRPAMAAFDLWKIRMI